MTAKNKSIQLADTFNDSFINKNGLGYSPLQKWCAYIVAKECLKVSIFRKRYWKNVINELEKL